MKYIETQQDRINGYQLTDKELRRVYGSPKLFLILVVIMSTSYFFLTDSLFSYLAIPVAIYYIWSFGIKRYKEQNKTQDIKEKIIYIDSNTFKMTIDQKEHPMYSLSEYDNYVIVRYGTFGQNIVSFNKNKLNEGEVNLLLSGLEN